MKMKTDFYTKAILTVIAIALVGNFLKDVDFVSKANAKSTNLADIKKEQEQQATEQPDITYYVYDNELLVGGFGKNDYYPNDNKYVTSSKNSKEEAYINPSDVPQYIITSKTGSFMVYK